MADRLNQLLGKRSDLEQQGLIREMISVQLAIVAEVETTARVPDLANAWNYLSELRRQVGDYANAEHAARKALDVYASAPAPSAEALGCYQFKLAQILAAQRRFSEAVPIAEAGIRSYAAFHNPPDAFLIARQEEAALMRECSQREPGVTE